MVRAGERKTCPVCGAAGGCGTGMLEINGIDVFYGDAQALWEVSLQVKEKEIVTLLGGNGAGKSTTLRAVSGLLKPRKGSISLAGVRLDRINPHQIILQGLSHVPEGRRLFANMTVMDNLLAGAYTPAAWKNREAAIQGMVEIFPILKERRNQLAGTLSGGEQQMCAIARAMVSQPRVLLLDEPSLGLAPVIVERIFEVVQKINENGVTVLLVEQNAHIALQIAHRGYVIETGRMVLEGVAAELLQNDYIKKAYLGI
jgi:branched-chain amino acid transport system ATP-binding protein